MPPERVGHTGSGADIFAAQSSDGTVMAALIATDFVAVVPGVRAEEREGYLEGLRQGIQLRTGSLGLSVESSEADKFQKFEGWTVSGTTPREPGYFNLRAFRSGRREFILWCELEDSARFTACVDAFAGLAVGEQGEDSAGVAELQEGFVLDDPEVPVRYTPPGKGWVGRGPRLGGMGSQKVWTWAKLNQPQLDVAVAPLPAANAKLDTQGLGERVAQGYRMSGQAVTKMSAVVDGRDAVRLKLDGGRLPIQDLIIVVHDGHLCSLLITHHQQRDERFIATALQGFRFR